MRTLVSFLLLPFTVSAATPWSAVLKQDALWYSSAEARTIAENVVLYQTSSGGWPKNTDMTQPPSADFLAHTEPDHRAATLDNGATTTQLQLVARVASAQPNAQLESAIERGIDYLIASQSASGGWPQYFPHRPGYYSHITYNDNAMVNVLTVLRAISRAEAPFDKIDRERRTRAAAAVDRGVACILGTQIVQEGKLTVWCAQHDELTLAPAWARNFEPPSLSGLESVGVVRFLMSIEAPTPAVIASIEGAVAWLRARAISGLRIDSSTTNGERDRLAVPDANAPPLWARFYELGTNRPIYVGRDRVVRYHHNEIERERRVGYGYLGSWPAELIDKYYPRWKAQHVSAISQATL